MTSIPFTSIIEGDRARDKKKYGDLSPLADSIRSVGTIQPIVLSKRPATDKELALADGSFVYDLIAGGRRYQTMKTRLKPDRLYHGSTLDPEHLGFVFADEVPEHIRKEAELDENLHRLEMDWIDSCLLVHDIHLAKRAQAQADGKRWGEAQTGKLLGKGFGKSNINTALFAAEVLRGKHSEDKKKEMLTTCSNLADTVSLRAKWREDEALAEVQRRNASRMPAAPVSSSSAENTKGTASFLDSLNITLGKTTKLDIKGGDSYDPGHSHLSRDVSVATHVQPVVATQPVEVPLSRMFFCSDFRKVINPNDPPFLVDHVVTDIPYGIDMDNLDEKQVASVKDTHDVEQNVSQMQDFLQCAFAMIKPGGFCVFSYDLDHHEKLQTWAKAAGFRVQRWPFIAAKTSACQNNAAQYNTTKNYEAVMYLRKDERTVLRKPIPTSWKAYDFAAERRLYNNPFAKPFEFWKDIYDAIAFPGQSVLDPFCGEMSACRAAANCGLVPYGIEISEGHYLRGLEHMKSVYALIHKSNVLFT